MLQRNHSDVAAAAAAGESMIAGILSPDSGELTNGNGAENLNKSEGGGVVDESGGEGVINWQNARCKAEILTHLLYDQLSAHVACLRIATPVDQLPRIDAQLAQSQNVVAKYSALVQGLVGVDKELDQFMTHIMFCCFVPLKNNFNNMFVSMQWKQLWLAGRLSNLYKV